MATCGVEVDQLVASAPLQPPAVDQLFQPLPLVRVREHVRVEVHTPYPRLTGEVEGDRVFPTVAAAQLWHRAVPCVGARRCWSATNRPDTRWIARTGRPRRVASAGVLGSSASTDPATARSSTDSPRAMSSVADDAVAVLDLLGVDRVGGARDVGRRWRTPQRCAAPPPRPGRGARRRRRTLRRPAAADGRRCRGVRWSGPARSSRSASAGVARRRPRRRGAGRALAGRPACRTTRTLLGAALSTADLAASVREALADHDGYLRDAALTLPRLGASTSRTSAAPPTSGTAPATSAARPATGDWLGRPDPGRPARGHGPTPPTWPPCSRTGRTSSLRCAIPRLTAR